ncbi:MAG: serine hydrolase [Nitrospirota bacterium]
MSKKNKIPNKLGENKPLTQRWSRDVKFVAGGTFAAGLLLGAMAVWLMQKDVEAPIEVRQGSYEFINPLMECEFAEESIRQQALVPFKKDILKVIEEQKKQGALSEASVYFRDMNNGPTFGIGEKEGFAPASLLKVITMMTVLHAAEADEKMLQTKLRHVPRKTRFKQQVIASPPLKLGAAYTIDDLLYRMIAFSDNDAAFLLGTFIGTDLLNELCRDLGVPTPDDRKEYLLSVKQYASFFRILYNASYLNRKMSERGLQYLSRSEYKNGIVSGVPPAVMVAHKFGEREHTAPDGAMTKQLHDCGIVYYPDHPYLLCIMTRGKDFDKLSHAIQDISRTVYNELHDQYK